MRKFELGQVVITHGALAVLSQQDILNALSRHSKGDWGEICEEDKAENEFHQRGIPATMIIGKDGTIEMYKLGCADWGSPKVVSWLRGLALQ